MTNTMTEYRFFDITEYDEEAEYLTAMHRRGWKLTKVSFPGKYYFEACEPADVIYQLDYNQEGRDNLEEYTQMFKDCGWEYLFDFVGYSYFRKPAEGEVEESIFCDEESRLDMILRVYKGRLIPLIVIFCALLLPNEFRLLHRLGQSISVQTLFGFHTLLIIAYLYLFLRLLMKYRSIKERTAK